MNYIVSYSDFRKRMSDFASIAMAGGSITVRDQKKRVPLFKVVKADEDTSDWKEYVKFVESLGGSGLLASKSDNDSRKRFRDSLDKKFLEAKN